MEIKEFIRNIEDQFYNAPAEGLKPETVFHELGEWSSLVALSVMAMIEEEYEVQIRADEMRKAHTVNDLFETVKSKK